MAIVNQYIKKQQNKLLSIDYFCSLFAISTFIMLCLRGMILSYRGFFTVIIWSWLLLLLMYLIKISREILDIDMYFNFSINSWLRFVVLFKHLNMVILIFTLAIIANTLFHLI